MYKRRINIYKTLTAVPSQRWERGIAKYNKNSEKGLGGLAALKLLVLIYIKP